MVKPLKLYEQLRWTPFVQTRIITLYFGISSYDAVEGQDNDGDWVKQPLDDLPAKEDCNQFRICMEKFGATNPADIYDLSNNPSSKKTITAMTEIRKELNAGLEKQPQEKILVVCMFACHGILKDGV